MLARREAVDSGPLECRQGMLMARERRIRVPKITDVRRPVHRGAHRCSAAFGTPVEVRRPRNARSHSAFDRAATSRLATSRRNAYPSACTDGIGERRGGARSGWSGTGVALEESELVRGLREERDEAVREYLDRYRALFHHCIAQFESDPTTREDLQQELAWYALERLREGVFDAERGTFGTWLYRVAWCRCVDLKRQANARRRVRLEPVGDELPENADPAAPPSESAVDSEIAGKVRAGMRELAPDDRKLLELRFVDAVTLPEIATRLGITLEQAKYRLKRASGLLRRALLATAQREELVD